MTTTYATKRNGLSPLIAVLTLVVALAGISGPAGAASTVTYTGVNLASGEFGIDVNGTAASSTWPGSYGTNSDWQFPTQQEVDYFVGKGMNIIRIPFAWERLQPSAYGNLDSTALSGLQSIVNYATNTKGATALIDMHNYAFYYKQRLGRDIDKAAFADVWSKLANVFKNNSKVFFGLMNEPHDTDSDRQGTRIWRESAQAAINAIRNAGATNKIFVSGNGWDHAYNWVQDTVGGGSQAWYGEWNGVELANLTDSANNLVFEVHEYIDKPDRNGATNTQGCFDSPSFAAMFQPMTDWLRNSGRKGFVGEFSFNSSDSTCVSMHQALLNYLQDNSDVWLGWTYWAAGPRWGSYCGVTCIEPTFNGDGTATDKPHMAILRPYFAGSTSTPPSGGGNITVYGDSLASGWNDWSWGASNTFNNTSPIANGSNSIKTVYGSNGGGLSLQANTGVSASSSAKVTFNVYADGSDQGMEFYINTADSSGETTHKSFTARGGQWTPITINLSDIGSPSVIKRLNFTHWPAATVYFDDITITNGSSGGSGNTRNGSWAAKLVAAGGWQNLVQFPSTLSTNTNYTAQIYFKGSGTFDLRIHAGQWGTELGASNGCTASGSWQTCTINFNSGGNTQVTFRLTDSTNGGTIYFDDAFLGTSGGTNLLGNSGFESGNTVWSATSPFSIVQNP